MLVGGEHIFARLHGSSEKDGQNSRCHWVKRAGVARLGFSENPSHSADNGKGGKPLAFIYYYNSVFQLIAFLSVRCFAILFYHKEKNISIFYGQIA